MNLSGNKSEIFNKIKLYLSIANSNIDNNESIQDILSSDDNPLNFIFDLANITVGENALEILTQVVISKVITQEYLNKLSDKIYDFVGDNIPTQLQISSTTISLPLPTIDPTNVFKKDPQPIGTGNNVPLPNTTPAQQSTSPTTSSTTTTTQVLKTVSFIRSEPLSNPDLDLVHGALGSSRLADDFEKRVQDELTNQFNAGKKPDVTNIQVKTYIQGNDIITEASCDIVESTDGIAYTIFSTRGSIGKHPPIINDPNSYDIRHDNQINYPSGDTSQPQKVITKRLEDAYNGVAKALSTNGLPPGPFTILLTLNGQDYGYKQSFYTASEYSKTQQLINQVTTQVTNQITAQTQQFVNQITAQTQQFFNTIKTQVLQGVNNTSVSVNLLGTNKQIGLKYNETQNSIDTLIPNLSALELFTGLRVLIGPMFSANVVINEILNILFHTDFTEEDAQVLTMVRSYTQFQTKDVFKMDLKKLLDIELDSVVKGYNIDVSCFRDNITITKGQIDKIISNPTVENFKTLVPEFATETTTTPANENAKKDFFKKLIQAILDAILSIIVKQPVIMFFISMYHKILDFSINLFDVTIPQLFDKFKIFLENLFDNIFEEIFCIFLNWVKKYLIKLVVSVTIVLLKEQLQKRRDILLSLSGSKYVTKLKEIKSIGQEYKVIT